MNLPWPSHRFLGCPWSEVDVALRLWARGAALMDMWRFPEMGVPHSYISSISRWDFPLETIIEMGYPHFRKPPYIYTLGITGSSLVRYFIYFYIVLYIIFCHQWKNVRTSSKKWLFARYLRFTINSMGIFFLGTISTHLGLWIALIDEWRLIDGYWGQTTYLIGHYLFHMNWEPPFSKQSLKRGRLPMKTSLHISASLGSWDDDRNIPNGGLLIRMCFFFLLGQCGNL